MTALAIALVLCIAIPSLAWWHREMRRMRAHAESAAIEALRVELRAYAGQLVDASDVAGVRRLDELRARIDEAEGLARNAQNVAQLKAGRR